MDKGKRVLKVSMIINDAVIASYISVVFQLINKLVWISLKKIMGSNVLVYAVTRMCFESRYRKYLQDNLMHMQPEESIVMYPSSSQPRDLVGSPF